MYENKFVQPVDVVVEKLPHRYLRVYDVTKLVFVECVEKFFILHVHDYHSVGDVEQNYHVESFV